MKVSKRRKKIVSDIRNAKSGHSFKSLSSNPSAKTNNFTVLFTTHKWKHEATVLGIKVDTSDSFSLKKVRNWHRNISRSLHVK